VRVAEAQIPSRLLTLEYDPVTVTADTIQQALERAGYEVGIG
jgi:hypothetical protein